MIDLRPQNLRRDRHAALRFGASEHCRGFRARARHPPQHVAQIGRTTTEVAQLVAPTKTPTSAPPQPGRPCATMGGRVAESNAAHRATPPRPSLRAPPKGPPTDSRHLLELCLGDSQRHPTSDDKILVDLLKRHVFPPITLLSPIHSCDPQTWRSALGPRESAPSSRGMHCSGSHQKPRRTCGV